MSQPSSREVPIDLLLIILMVVIFASGVLILARSPELLNRRYEAARVLSHLSG